METSTMLFEVEASTSQQKSQMSPAQVRQVLAQALIEKLHNWCMQLFWMTVLCVINCCGDESQNPQPKKSRKASTLPKRTSIEDIEQKMLRHLTSPYVSAPLRPVHRPKRTHFLSRPPSPQLFDIAEEE